jgi:hypothetical protein
MSSSLTTKGCVTAALLFYTMEEQAKPKKFIYRFYHPLTGAKLNLWASTDDTALRIFGIIVNNAKEWKLREASKSSGRNKQVTQ